MGLEKINNLPSQNESLEKGDNPTKKELLKLKESLTTEALSKIGFKIKQGNEKGKYNLIFDIKKRLLKINDLKLLTQNTNTDLSSLLEIQLNKINIPLSKLVSVAEFINRLIDDSKGKDVFLTEKGFGSISSTYRKHNNTTDFAVKGNYFGKSLIGGTEELTKIIGPDNEQILVDFINKINKNRKIIEDYINDLKKI